MAPATRRQNHAGMLRTHQVIMEGRYHKCHIAIINKKKRPYAMVKVLEMQRTEPFNNNVATAYKNII